MDYLGTTVAEQAITFLYVVALGIGLGAVYDVFRIIRVAFGGKKAAVFVEDVLFSLVALVITFVFVITFNNGELRFFVLIGELLGFTAYYFTVGKLVMGFSKAIVKAVKAVLRFVLKPFVRLFGAVSNKIKAKKEKTPKNIKKTAQKPLHIFKKHLKTDK